MLKNKEIFLLLAALCVCGFFLLSLEKESAEYYVDKSDVPESYSILIEARLASSTMAATHSPKKMQIDKVDTASKMQAIELEALEILEVKEEHNKVIIAAELFDDGRIDLSHFHEGMLKAGKLFSNELASLTELTQGDLVSIQLPYLEAHAVMSDNKIDDQGNNIVVLDFQGQDNGFMTLSKSSATGNYNGEIYINGNRYTYTANKDVGVLVDMRKYVTWSH